MLNWICPDCGRECAPSNRECPACADQARVSPSSLGVQTAVHAVQNQPSVMLLAPAVHTPNGNGNGNGAHEAPQPTAETLRALVENLEQQIQPEPEVVQAPSPEAAPPIAPLVIQPPLQTLTADRELDESARQAFIEAQQAHAEELLELQAQDAARHGAILKIASSLQLAPQTPLLNAAPEVIVAPAPMQMNCAALPRPAITIRPPADSGAAPVASPHAPLLAGPILPAELQSLGGGQASARVKHVNKSGVPTWMISVTVITVMILGVGSVMQKSADHGAPSPNTAAPAAALQASEPMATTSEQQPHPLAKYVEVTGLRVVADLQRHSQLHYIVVNHSASELSGLGLEITVRAAAQETRAPLFRVSAVVPSLGPYQAKEIRTDLDAQLQSKPVPDWDSLKVDVQVTAH